MSFVFILVPQEPGTDTEIKEFVTAQYGTICDLYSKINVNGSQAHPIFQWLKQKLPGSFFK